MASKPDSPSLNPSLDSHLINLALIDPALIDRIVRQVARQILGRASAAGPAPTLPAPSPAAPADPSLFTTPYAEAIKQEICAAGRKLWLRYYVDGNGGNISCRIGPNEVLCTPTLISKYDLTPDDLCLVDLHGNQLAGAQNRTSEILLHLEIYKAVPHARAALHCHPPHATAYAVTGRVPPGLAIPEYEIFVGQVAVAPYATPGTTAFAQTVLPFVSRHNTVLLRNHGVVCWADSVTHAEWCAEVLETYCWTMLIAAQLGGPIHTFTPPQEAELLQIKQRYGLPDPRLPDSHFDAPEIPASPPALAESAALSAAEFDALVRQITRSVIDALSPKRP